MRICVTGGCGFIASHFIEHILRNTDWQIVALDNLQEASAGFKRLRQNGSLDGGRVTLFTHNITQPIPQRMSDEIGELDYIVHMAAQSDVDAAIRDPIPCIHTNVMGTAHMLEFARSRVNQGLKRFLYFSTDEVFGAAPPGVFYKEWDRFRASNPYAGGKAGGECLVDAWAKTYGVPAFSTHTMNVYGETQCITKFVPMIIKKILNGETVQIHADPTLKISGSRCWIHARNVSAAVLWLLPKSEPGERYNITGPERDNVWIAQTIADEIGKPLSYKLIDFHGSRAGHDLRYSLSDQKLKDMGWEYPVTLEASLRKTVRWTLERPEWLSI